MSILIPGAFPDGYYGYDPVDSEAASIIAGIAAGKSDKAICPHIEHCHRRCMSILNLMPETDDQFIAKLFGALDILQGKDPPPEHYDDYLVAIECDKDYAHCTPSMELSLPRSLLKKRPHSIREEFEEMCAKLDRGEKQIP